VEAVTIADIITAAAHAYRLSSVTIMADSERDARERLQELALLEGADLGADPTWEDNIFGGVVWFGASVVHVMYRREVAEVEVAA